MREKTIYRETFKKGVTVKQDRLPNLLHTNGMQPAEMHIIAAGIVSRGADRFEYQDVRFYFARQEPKPPYPEFCHTPDKCAGLSYCPRDPCCCD